MSITAAQNYVQGLLQGLVGAYKNQPLQAWVDPPVATASGETPQAYILSADGDGERQTMGFTSGFYEDTHQVYVYLEWMFPPNAPNANLAFTNLMDTCITKVRTSYTGAIFITDPASGTQSQLLVIGDRLRWKYLPQRTIDEAGQGWLDYSAQIIFEVKMKEQYVGIANRMIMGDSLVGDVAL